MEKIIIILFVLASMAMIGLILLQQGTGADMGASFGSGGSQTVFGAAGGGNVLTRGTAILAALFFAGSFGLAIIAKNKAVGVDSDAIPLPALEQQALDLPVVEEPDTGLDIPVIEEAAVGEEIPEAVIPGVDN